MKLRHLAVSAVLTMAALGMPSPAHAEVFRVECTRFPGAFPGATGGDIVITPEGMIIANCQYPGPAEGGGADAFDTYTNCVVTPAGNFQCVGPHGP